MSMKGLIRLLLLQKLKKISSIMLLQSETAQGYRVNAFLTVLQMYLLLCLLGLFLGWLALHHGRRRCCGVALVSVGVAVGVGVDVVVAAVVEPLVSM